MKCPSSLPPYGTCLPCIWRHSIDGQTVVIAVQDALRVRVFPDWVLRLLSVSCSHGDMEALHECESILEHSGDLSVWIPDVQALEVDGYALDGYIYVEQNRTLNEMMCEAGYGTGGGG